MEMNKLEGLMLTNPPANNEGLQLSPITVKEAYAREWNVNCKDFVCMTMNGEILHYHLLRVGGVGHSNINGQKYFMLLKYNEGLYEDSIHLDPTKKKHLEGCWTIFDDKGNIKFEAKPFDTPYIVKNSCIYTMKEDYYNIETGEFYCHASKCIESDNYLFLEASYHKDIAKRGGVENK